MTERDSELSSGARPMRAGILGCGWFGGVHAERLSRMEGIEVAALCDLSAEAMDRIVERIAASGRPSDGVAQYTDYRDMIASGDLDMLVVYSPDALHVEQILDGLAKGLHVLSEKPLTLVAADVDRVVQAGGSAGRLVGVTYPFRYRPSTRALRSVLQSGRWGRVTAVSVHQQEDWITPNIGTWRHDPALCPGGCFADANGHTIDAVLWTTGLEAFWVRATTKTCGTPVPITTWGEARLVRLGEAAEDGIPMVFSYFGDAHTWKDEIIITTEKADFVMSGNQLLYSKDRSPLAPYPEAEIDAALLAYPSDPDQAFLDEIRGGAPIISPPESALPVLRFTLAGLESAAHGGVPWSTSDL